MFALINSPKCTLAEDVFDMEGRGRGRDGDTRYVCDGDRARDVPSRTSSCRGDEFTRFTNACKGAFGHQFRM